MTLTLHGYFRSSASWRVRIALNLKGLDYDSRARHLLRGEQRAEDYLTLNPQGFVPSLSLADGAVLTQSLAICEYLEEAYPQTPILPRESVERARVRAFAQVIASDIHPIQNLKILKRLRHLGLDAEQAHQWARAIISEGFDACAALLAKDGHGPFCFGNSPTLADICLIPQLANARRFGVDLKWDRLLEVEAHCSALPAFSRAAPENQPDAE